MEALSKTLDAAVYPQTFDEFSTHFSDEDAVSCGEYSVETYWSTDILPTIVEETEEEALSVMTPCRPCERLDTQKEDESIQYEEEICSFLSEDDYTYVTYVTCHYISMSPCQQLGGQAGGVQAAGSRVNSKPTGVPPGAPGAH